jgi:hypothetical protein
VRHLHTKNFKADSLDTVLKSHNLAQYLGLSRVEALHMPIPLNIVLVGFSADGNLQVNISTAQIQEWLGHLDHVLPHTRIQLSQLTCAEDGETGWLVTAIIILSEQAEEKPLTLCALLIAWLAVACLLALCRHICQQPLTLRPSSAPPLNTRPASRHRRSLCRAGIRHCGSAVGASPQHCAPQLLLQCGGCEAQGSDDSI